MSFTETFDKLFELAENVLKYNTNGELSLLTQASAIQVGLNKYKLVYEQTKENPAKHIEKFKEVYSKCRPQLIKSKDLDSFMLWFKDSSLLIQPGEKAQSKIYLTVIFRNCCRIAENIAEQVDKDPSKAYLSNDPAAVYPEYFMLYLFRLFSHAADQVDRDAILIPKITQLEVTLGLKKDQSPVMSDGLSDLFSAVGDIAKDMGISLPNGGQGLSAPDFQQMLGSLKNPETKNQMKEMFKGVNLKDAKDLPKLFERLMGKMSETATQVPEPVQRSLDATAPN